MTVKRYLCVQCDERFESGDKRPRCPKCMRTSGLQEISAEQGRGTSVALPAKLGVAGLVALLGLGGGYLALTSGAEKEPSPPAPVEADDLQSELAAAGASAEELSDFFEADEAIVAFATALGPVNDPVAAAARLKKALRHGDAGTFQPLALVEPRTEPPMNAAEAFAAFARDGDEPAKLYPLEVAAMAVAAMRSRGVDALVAEVAQLDNGGRPLDPSGCMGYFLLAVPAPEKPGEYRYIDVYGGRNLPHHPSGASVLSDAQAVAHALGVTALTRIAAQREPERALREVEAGLALAPSSPVLRTVRAVALAANGGVAQGEEAVRAALQLRPDAPRYNQLATYLLQTGDAAGAEKAVQKALEESPNFASAYVSLASVHLLRGQTAEALQALEQASALSPDLPGLDMAYVQYFAANGQLDVAIDRAEKAVARRVQEPQFYLTLGRLYLAVGRTADMQSCARKVIELSPVERQAKMEKVVAAVLGPDALSDEGGDPSISASQL